MDYLIRINRLKEEIETNKLFTSRRCNEKISKIRITSSEIHKDRWLRNYQKYMKIEDIPIIHRIIITKHANDLKWLFYYLQNILVYNFGKSNLPFFYAVLSQNLQDYLKEHGDPEKPKPLLNVTIEASMKWYEHYIKNFPEENMKKFDYNLKKIRILNLENKIFEGNIKKAKRSFQGADVIITNQHTRWAEEYHQVISFQQIPPRHREVLTKHYLEVSTIFFELQYILSDTFDFINKYDFYGLLAIKGQEYLETYGDPDTPTPLLLAVLDGGKIWLKHYKKMLF